MAALQNVLSLQVAVKSTALTGCWDAIYKSMEWPQWWQGVLLLLVREKKKMKYKQVHKWYVEKLYMESVLPYRLNFY